MPRGRELRALSEVTEIYGLQSTAVSVEFAEDFHVIQRETDMVSTFKTLASVHVSDVRRELSCIYLKC